MSLTWKITVKDYNDKRIAEIDSSKGKYQDLALHFDINRDTDSLPNSGTFLLYNLYDSDRNLLKKYAPIISYDFNSAYSIDMPTGYTLDDYRSIVLSVNKDKKESIIFKGTIIECNSTLQGSEWITQIQCGDGSHAQKFISLDATIEKGGDIKDLIKHLFENNKMSAEFKGKPYASGKAATFSSLIEMLDFAYPNNWFIDNEKLNCFGKDSTFQKATYIISGSKIKKSPEWTKNYLRMEIVFTPELKLGQIVNVDNNAEKSYRGDWELAGIEHRGELGSGAKEEPNTEILCVQPRRRFDNL